MSNPNGKIHIKASSQWKDELDDSPILNLSISLENYSSRKDMSDRLIYLARQVEQGVIHPFHTPTADRNITACFDEAEDRWMLTETQG